MTVSNVRSPLPDTPWSPVAAGDAPSAGGPPASVFRKARFAVAGFITLMGMLGALALASPDWVTADTLEVESSQVSEASIRLAMVRERQRVEEFMKRTGRLPVTLAEAGGYQAGIHYTAGSDGTYALDADVGGTQLRLASTGSVEGFLGNSLQVILNRPVQ